MKTPRRTVTIGIILAVASCAVIIALRSFAQPGTSAGPYDIDLTGKWQKLKPPYDEDADGYRDNVLCKNAKAFYIVHHRKSDGKESKHDKTKCSGHADASESLIIPVANPASSPAPSPSGTSKMIMGPSVTQQIACLDAQSKQTVLNTFDTSSP
jgi:hypothetical protein